jgi:mlo protein
MGGDGDGTRALDQTPTWAVAAVCAVIVAASILLEGLLHHLGQVSPPARTIPFPAFPPSIHLSHDALVVFLY